MKRRLRSHWLPTLAGALLAIPVFAAVLDAETVYAETAKSGQVVGKYGIEGVVVGGKEGKPLEGATITLNYGARDEGTRFSSSSGAFNFYPLEPGEYEVRAYYGNTKIVCKPVRVPRVRVAAGKEYPEAVQMRIVFPPDPEIKQTLEQDALVDRNE